MTDILNTKNHSVRRNLGSTHYSQFPTYEKASSRKSFSDDIEKMLNDRISHNLTMSYILVNLGRKELEERLFDKLQPKYCIKGKRGTKKAFIKSEKQIEHRNAYEKWTTEEDEKLEMLLLQRKIFFRIE